MFQFYFELLQVDYRLADMDTVLLVEDDGLFREMLRDTLQPHDFNVMEAISGKRSLEILQEHPVDLIVLDLHLVDGYGLDFMPRIRTHTQAPVIILSGEHSQAEKIKGLKKGADDYMTKPFDPDELLARIQANLRRQNMPTNAENACNGSLSSQRVILFGQWRMDRDQFQVFNQENDESINLTAREFQLLELLILSAGRALRRDALCHALKEGSYVPTGRAIDVKITRLRRKLVDAGDRPEIIKTIHGIGYMLNQETLRT